MSMHNHFQVLFFGLFVLFLADVNKVTSPEMALQFSSAQLRTFPLGSPRLAPDTYKWWEQLGILHRPCYIHRSRKKLWTYHCSSSNSIPVFCTNTCASSKIQQENRIINFGNLRPLRFDPVLGHGNIASLDMRCALLNTRSLTDKALVLNDIIIDTNLDMLLLTETWQVPNDFFNLNLLTPPGYIYFSQPRLHRRGGGLAVICRESIKISKIEFHDIVSFEYLALKKTGKTSMAVILIYRPFKIAFRLFL